VQNPPYFEGMKKDPEPIVDVVDARILAVFGDKITTDHISPAGAIKLTSLPEDICPSIRCARPISISTARVAAIMR
jgi:aconitase A